MQINKEKAIEIQKQKLMLGEDLVKDEKYKVGTCFADF